MTLVSYTIELLLHLSKRVLDRLDILLLEKENSHFRSRVSRVERQQSKAAVLPNHS